MKMNVQYIERLNQPSEKEVKAYDLTFDPFISVHITVKTDIKAS